MYTHHFVASVSDVQIPQVARVLRQKDSIADPGRAIRVSVENGRRAAARRRIHLHRREGRGRAVRDRFRREEREIRFQIMSRRSRPMSQPVVRLYSPCVENAAFVGACPTQRGAGILGSGLDATLRIWQDAISTCVTSLVYYKIKKKSTFIYCLLRGPGATARHTRSLR